MRVFSAWLKNIAQVQVTATSDFAVTSDSGSPTKRNAL